MSHNKTKPQYNKSCAYLMEDAVFDACVNVLIPLCINPYVNISMLVQIHPKIMHTMSALCFVVLR